MRLQDARRNKRAFIRLPCGPGLVGLIILVFVLAGCSLRQASGLSTLRKAEPSALQNSERNPRTERHSSTSSPRENGDGTGSSLPSGAGKVVAARVTKIVDGDTIYVKVEGREEKVRFIGVNTPELANPERGQREEPFGREAKAYTEKELSGRQVYLEFDVQLRDKYGRLLAYVWLERPQKGTAEEARVNLFNARLLLDGYAQVMTVPPNVKYVDLFLTWQREAQKNRRGLWGLSPRTSRGIDGSVQAPGSSQRRVPYAGTV